MGNRKHSGDTKGNSVYGEQLSMVGAEGSWVV